MDELTDFRNGTGQQHMKAFSPLQYCDINRNSNTVVVELSLVIQESMASNNIINISMVLLNDLNPAASILYITLSNFMNLGIFSMNLRKLIQHIGLQDRNTPRSVRTLLQSLQELKFVDFIDGFEIIKIRKGHEILHINNTITSTWVFLQNRGYTRMVHHYLIKKRDLRGFCSLWD